MDIFAEPDDPVQSILDKTPYLCIEHWDGGVFRTYSHRKGKTSIIPLMLRQVPNVPPPEQPYLENLYPTPPDELQPFLQTWLYFGMLAEMLCLNEVSPGVRLVEEDMAKHEIAKLHELLTVDDNGTRLITAAEVLTWGPLLQERLALAPNKVQRLIYQLECLQYAMVMVHSIQDNVDHEVRYSIAALGELFSTGIYAAASLAQPRIELPILGLSWYRDYVRAGGVVEAKMLRNGWCPSEVEKIRAQLQGLFTMHYTSQLRRPMPWLDHSTCTRHLCRAFHIDIATYRPSHVQDGCTCTLIEADPGTVERILKSSDSFPVVRVEGDVENLRMSVERFEEGVSYVALSHVWANGLGNPTSNSLPRCQIARIVKLIEDLPKAPGRTDAPRLWLDTLCCPVELDAKLISLARIADVYRKAHHVLVLDTTLTAFTYEGTHPAELLVRAFECSPWMRRLWTLQEGALARTLQIQYADKAGNNMAMLTELWKLARKDARYMRIWQDVTNEFNQLLGFSPKTGPENTLTWAQPQITTLQRSLHFRTVSVPSDEPLCISTLMNLDTQYIAAGRDADHRMARMWEQLASAKGGIPARLIFYMDEQIDIPSWRWAPRSLLASAVDDPVLGIDERVMRFYTDQASQNPADTVLGVPTSLGLRVRLPGCRIMPVPLLPNLPLHAWPEVIKPTEDQVVLQDRLTGQWFRLFDWYRSKKLPTWTRKERLEYDGREKGPLCRAIHTGKCALIMEQKVTVDDGTTACCLVQVEELSAQERLDVGYADDEDKEKGQVPLKARRERAVIMSAMGEAEGRMMGKIRDMAVAVARDAATDAFLEVQRRCVPGEEDWDIAEEKVRGVMKRVMEEAWRADGELRQTFKDTVGEDLDDYIWVFVPKVFSHGIEMRELSGQLWFVD